MAGPGRVKFTTEMTPMQTPTIDTDALTSRLGQVAHFTRLSPAELRAIITCGVVHRFPKDQLIYAEGQPSSGMYVLIKGKVQICKLGPQGQLSILNVFEPVIMFNEVAALDHFPNPATAVALADCLLWQISPENLEAIILRHPQVGLGMLRVLAARSRHLMGAFEDLSFRTVLARCAKLLLEVSAGGSQAIDRRKHPNAQLAGLISTGPEPFSRCLKTFRATGAISTSNNLILVLDVAQLRDISE